MSKCWVPPILTHPTQHLSNMSALHVFYCLQIDQALDDMIKWLNDSGRVGIYDATNHTRARRQQVYDQLTKQCNAKVWPRVRQCYRIVKGGL